jgi:hypothetical protein
MNQAIDRWAANAVRRSQMHTTTRGFAFMADCHHDQPLRKDYWMVPEYKCDRTELFQRRPRQQFKDISYDETSPANGKISLLTSTDTRLPPEHSPLLSALTMIAVS